MTKRPANLQMDAITAVWDTSGWKSLGMPFGEFLRWMLRLDEVYIEYCEKHSR